MKIKGISKWDVMVEILRVHKTVQKSGATIFAKNGSQNNNFSLSKRLRLQYNRHHTILR